MKIGEHLAMTLNGAAERPAHQPRAVWSGTTHGTKSHPKMRPISKRHARRLHGPVGRLTAINRSREPCADHTPTQPHPARGASHLYYIPHTTTPRTTGIDPNHTPHEIRLSTTNRPHNG